MNDPALSVRENILETIKETFAALTVATNGLEFSRVDFGSLGQGDHTKRYTCGIVVGPETEKETLPFVNCTLQIGIEFRITIQKSDPNKTTMGEKVLTVLKNTVKANETWGGLALWTKRINNEIDTEIFGDRTVAGVLFLSVAYRHMDLDVRVPAGPDL